MTISEHVCYKLTFLSFVDIYMSMFSVPVLW